MKRASLLLVVLLAMVSWASGQVVTDGDWTYFVENGGVMITASTATGDVTIPSELGGYLVKEVGRDGPTSIFGPNNASVTSVSIPDSVTSIGIGAFYKCIKLTGVTIPNTVTSIGTGAFQGCTELTSVSIPESVTNIGEYAFYKCTGLTSLTIGDRGSYVADDGVTTTFETSVGERAFGACPNLKVVKIPLHFDVYLAQIFDSQVASRLMTQLGEEAEAPIRPLKLAALSPVDPLPSAGRAYGFAFTHFLSGKKTTIVDKRVGPIRAIATAQDDSLHESVSQAVGEINDAFGYGKIALSWSDKVRMESDSLTIFIGSKRQCRQLIEDFGVSSPRGFGYSTYYYWWDGTNRHHIERAIIAINDAIPKARLSEELRYLLLACMGFPNFRSAREYRHFMSEREHQRQPTSMDADLEPAFSDSETAIIRFWDKHVHPKSKEWEVKKIFQNEWPDFSAAYCNPQANPVSN